MTMQDFDTAMTRAAGRPRFLAGSTGSTGAAGAGPDPQRLTANFAAIEAEIDAPAPRLLARLLLRFGVSEGTVPLVTATPALRRSWVAAVTVAVLFALSAASSNTGDGVDRIVIFLTLAPLIPLVGVALAFGPRVDPTHEVALAAPIDGFRLFLIRALTVVGASTLTLLIVSLLVPSGGPHRVAWLLPALATTTVTMALSTRFDPRMAAAAVAATWLVIVMVAVAATDAAAAFGPTMQMLSLFVTAAGAVGLGRRRRRLDVMSDR